MYSLADSCIKVEPASGAAWGTGKEQYRLDNDVLYHVL